MKLHFNKLGQGEPLVILHGLYGNGDNWFSIARKFEKKFTVYLVDQRNHGKSPHSEEMNYRILLEDLHSFVKEQNLSAINIIGHSMGGKVAMSYANLYPENVNKLVVVDISPRSYISSGRMSMQARFHESTIQTMLNLDLEKAKNRADLDNALSKDIENPAIRQFLLKNIKRTDSGVFFWQIYLKAFSENLDQLFAEVEKPKSAPLEKVPVLFIKGENSGYLNNSDPEFIANYYQNFRIQTIPGAGHWVHAEFPDIFVQQVSDFLEA